MYVCRKAHYSAKNMIPEGINVCLVGMGTVGGNN